MRVTALLFVATLLSGGGLYAAPEPSVEETIESISAALGGEAAGGEVLASAPGLDFVFERTVRVSHSNEELKVLHRYQRARETGRRRLDIRMLDGDGTDSATVITDSAAWLVVDGERIDVDAAAAGTRLKEFSPELLFSVPLALAADGHKLLGGANLVISEGQDAEGAPAWLLVSREDDGAERARLVVGREDFLPRSVAFRSPAGNVEFLYADYRQLAPGLRLPFRREFRRNGVRISATRVLRFVLEPVASVQDFDPGVLELPTVPTTEK